MLGKGESRRRGSSAVGGAGKNGGKFHTICEEEIAKLLPKSISKTAKILLMTDDNSRYLKNIYKN